MMCLILFISHSNVIDDLLTLKVISTFLILNAYPVFFLNMSLYLWKEIKETYYCPRKVGKKHGRNPCKVLSAEPGPSLVTMTVVIIHFFRGC